MNQTYLIRYRKEFQAQWVDFKHDCVDFNDLLYIAERTDEEIVGWEPVGMKKNRAHFNATTFFIRGGKKKTVFHVKPIYYVNTSGSVRPLSEVTLYHGNRNMQLTYDWAEKMDFGYLAWLIKRCALIGGGVSYSPSKIPVLLNASLTVYPDPNPESTSVDGWVAQDEDPSNIAWTTLRGSAGNAAGDSDPDRESPFLRSGSTNPSWRVLRRTITLFDTSSIPDNATKDSATCSIAGTAKTDNFSQSITIVQCAPASNTALVASDFANANWTMTAQNTTDITITSFSTTGYNDFGLNATGLTNVSITGITKFGFVLSGDRTNTEPAWSSLLDGSVTVTLADTAGTSSDPKLLVNYTAPASGGGGATSALLMMTGA